MTNEELFLQGDELYERKEFGEAFKVFLQAANNGDVSSMIRVASMYTCGEGIECDYDKAIEWEIKAAEGGNDSALFNLGVTYRIKGDIRKSKFWFEKALDIGDSSAAVELAKLYLASDKETDTVIRYLKRALSSGDMCVADVEEAKSLLSDLGVES